MKPNDMISLSCILKVPICLDIVNVIYQLVDRRRPYSVCKETGEYPIFLFLLVYVHDISLYMILVSIFIKALDIICLLFRLSNPCKILEYRMRYPIYIGIYSEHLTVISTVLVNLVIYGAHVCTLYQLLTMLASSCQLKALFHCICHCRF